jgi:hypothetical protein
MEMPQEGAEIGFITMQTSRRVFGDVAEFHNMRQMS